MKQLLRVQNLSKNQILHDISFEIEQGELLAIMGPSGSGKSTLLYNVAGMDEPDDGKIWLHDTELTSLSEDGKAKIRLHRMGFVFQQMNMISNLNLLDNILLPALQAKPKKAKLALTVKAQQLMEKLSISGLEQRKITEVSGGQLQRACICRSLMNDPEILFADEPTGALNQKAAAEVMAELVKLNQEGTTILIVTHDSKVASHCDRILYLLDGRICQEFTLNQTNNLKKREDLVNRWLAEMGW